MQAYAGPQCPRFHAHFGQHPANGEERGEFSKEKMHIAKACGDLSQHEESTAPGDGGILDLPAFRWLEKMHQGKDEGKGEQRFGLRHGPQQQAKQKTTEEVLFHEAGAERGGDGFAQFPPARVGAQLIRARFEKDEPEREQQTGGQDKAAGPLPEPRVERTPGGQQRALQPHPAHEGPDEKNGADEHGSIEVPCELRPLDFCEQPFYQAGIMQR